MVSRTQLRLLAAGATTALGIAALGWQKHEKRGRGLLFSPSMGTMVDAAPRLAPKSNRLPRTQSRLNILDKHAGRR